MVISFVGGGVSCRSEHVACHQQCQALCDLRLRVDIPAPRHGNGIDHSSGSIDNNSQFFACSSCYVPKQLLEERLEKSIRIQKTRKRRSGQEYDGFNEPMLIVAVLFDMRQYILGPLSTFPVLVGLFAGGRRKDTEPSTDDTYHKGGMFCQPGHTHGQLVFISKPFPMGLLSVELLF